MSGYSSVTLMSSAVTVTIGTSGTELANSRRILDLLDCSRGRVQFNSSAAISVRVEFSTDFGATWQTLIDANAYNGSNPYISTWFVLPDECKGNEIMLRAVGVGSGLFLTVNYVQFDFD
jgi:hypothetical protein